MAIDSGPFSAWSETRIKTKTRLFDQRGVLIYSSTGWWATDSILVGQLTLQYNRLFLRVEQVYHLSNPTYDHTSRWSEALQSHIWMLYNVINTTWFNGSCTTTTTSYIMKLPLVVRVRKSLIQPWHAIAPHEIFGIHSPQPLRPAVSKTFVGISTHGIQRTRSSTNITTMKWSKHRIWLNRSCWVSFAIKQRRYYSLPPRLVSSLVRESASPAIKNHFLQLTALSLSWLVLKPSETLIIAERSDTIDIERVRTLMATSRCL